MCIMRTTITLDNQVLEQLKERATASGASVSRLIEQAVRLFLRTTPVDGQHAPFELVTFGADGRFSQHNLDKASALLAAEDVERYGSKG